MNLDKEVIQKLKQARELISRSGQYPQGLSGACVIAAIIVQSILEQHNFNSIIINNSRHTFCLVDNTYVVDITATQISRTAFSEIECRPISEMRQIALCSPKGSSFYKTEDERFLLKGDLDNYLRVNTDIKDDDKGLLRLLRRFLTVIPLHHKMFDKLPTAEEATCEVVEEIAYLVRQGLRHPQLLAA